MINCMYTYVRQFTKMWQVYTQQTLHTIEGVSSSLIGLPSNLNLTTPDWIPWKDRLDGRKKVTNLDPSSNKKKCQEER